MTRLSFVPVLLLLSACKSEFSEMYQADPLISNALVEVAEQEAVELCVATDNLFCPVLTRELVNNRIIVREISAAGRAWTTAGTGTEPSYVTILINPKVLVDPETFRLVIRHELGHTAGCRGHLPDGNVMSVYTGGQSDTWTDADVQCIKRGLKTR